MQKKYADKGDRVDDVNRRSGHLQALGLSINPPETKADTKAGGCVEGCLVYPLCALHRMHLNLSAVSSTVLLYMQLTHSP